MDSNVSASLKPNFPRSHTCS